MAQPLENTGAGDGTRTRDLRRDRPNEQADSSTKVGNAAAQERAVNAADSQPTYAPPTVADRYGAGVEPAKPRHTPGPWKRGDCDGWIIWARGFREVSWKDCPDDVEKGEGVVIAVVEHPTWGKRDREAPGEWDNDIDGEITANARLIAAAPDLLSALELATREMRAMRAAVGSGLLTDQSIATAEAAIAKATLPTPGGSDE